MMLPAVPMQQASSPAVQLLLVHLLNITRYDELQNNVTVFDVEQFKLQNNNISALQQGLQHSTGEKQELEVKMSEMAGGSEELVSKHIRKHHDLKEQVVRQEEGKRDFQAGKLDLPPLYSMTTEFENSVQENSTSEDSALDTNTPEYTTDLVQVTTKTSTLYDLNQERTTTVTNEAVEFLAPKANNKFKNYEAEVDFKIEKGCKIVMTAVLENRSIIQFKLIDEGYEKELKMTFDLETNTVHKEFRTSFVNDTQIVPYELQKGKESTITIQFKKGGLKMCIDDSSNCGFLAYPYPGHYFNKIKIFDAQLHDIRFHVSEENKPTYNENRLECSRNICDLRNVPKIGTVFSFTGKIPLRSHWVEAYFKISDSRIPISMITRGKLNQAFTIFNHKEYDYWNISTAEIVRWFPFKRGQTYIFTFNIKKSGTTISVDGVFFHYFKHRMDVEAVTEFQYDWEMTDASYSTIVKHDFVQVTKELSTLDEFDQDLVTKERYEFLELLPPIANKEIKKYETEVGFKMEEGCKIVMKAVMETGSIIQFELVGEDDEKVINLTFNLVNKMVHKNFRSRYFGASQNTAYELQGGKESTITFQFREDGLRMCIDDSSNCALHAYPYRGHYFNKIKISKAELHDINFYVSEENKTKYIKNRLTCSENTCDLRNVPKIGTVFFFTGKMPDNNLWVNSDFMTSDSRIPIAMSIRGNLNYTVFNHMENYYWDYSKVEKEYWFPFKRGQMYTFIFHIQKTGTTISVDGVFFHYFKQRMDVEAVAEFQYDWEMIDASYSMIGKPVPYHLHSMNRENQNPLLEDNTSGDSALETNTPEYIRDLEQEGWSVGDLQQEIETTEYYKTDDCVTTIEEDELTSNTEFVEMSLPTASNKIKNYEKEVSFKIGKGCTMVMKAILETGSIIEFKLVGEGYEKQLKLTFDLENKTVQRYFKDEHITMWRNEPFELQKGKESTITIEFSESRIWMCVDDNISNCRIFGYPDPGHHFNKFKITDAELHDIRFYVINEINSIDEYEML